MSKTALNDDFYYRLNLMLAGAFLLLHLFIYFYLPLVLIPQSGWWALLLIPFVLTTTTFWALLHETFHGTFNVNPRINYGWGRMLSILFGSQHRIIRFGHLMHHRFNRTELDRSESIEAHVTSRIKATVLYYYWLLGGLYIYEVYSNFGFWLPLNTIKKIGDRALPDRDNGEPGMRPFADRHLISETGLRELRFDGVMVMLLLGSSLWCFGEYWYLLLIALLARGAMVSMVDNSFHYATPVDDWRYAYNLSLPRWASPLILNFNIHRIHHHQPILPWWKLPARQRKLGEGADIGMFRAVFRQLKGPIPIANLEELSRS